jgi:hypothetical protein
MTAKFHLGIDLGTAFCKLGLRHYNVRGDDRTYILYQPGTRDPTWPSLVAWDGQRLWFGCEAEVRDFKANVTIYRSLKMHFAFPNNYETVQAPELPQGMSIDDLLTWLTVYLLQKGHAVAMQKAIAQGEGDFQVTQTIGMPIAYHENPEMRERYRTLATVSDQLFRNCTLQDVDLAAGIPKAAAQSLLAVARDEAHALSQEDDIEWLRGEATAALLWAVKSPRTAPGRLYFDLDVGAGTASASSFIIDQRFYDGQWVKTHIGYYGAACQPPGADSCTAIVARSLGAKFAAIRGEENRFLAGAGHLAADDVKLLGHYIFRLVSRVLGAANKKLPPGGQMRNSELFLFGGGARIQAMRNVWEKEVIPGTSERVALTSLEAPPDLLGEDGAPPAEDTLDRLLVAYGLSHFCADFPESLTPEEFHPVQLQYQRRRQVDAEEMYPR